MINYDFQQGRQNETFVKELCVASAATYETFRLKSPYKMADHGSSENILNWADGHFEYKDLHTVITEAVAGFTHLYAYVVYKCTLLARMTGWPIHNLEYLKCPHPSLSITNAGVYCLVTSFSNTLV